jgi:hypothetical protein
MNLKSLETKEVPQRALRLQTEGIYLAYNRTGDRNDITEIDMKTIFSSFLESRRFSNRRTRHHNPTSN